MPLVSITNRKLKKRKSFITYRPWNIQERWDAGYTVSPGRRHGVGLGFYFNWGQEWGLKVLWAHFSSVNLKCESGNLKCKETKQ